MGEESKNAAEGADSANQNIEVFECDNNQDAFEILKNIVGEGDKVLIKGSRGKHTEEIVNNLKEYLSRAES